MKRHLLFTFILLVFISVFSNAQNLTGIWRGYFISGNTMEQYKYEVQIEHGPGNRLSGVTYSYLDKRFYGKTTMTGSFKNAVGDAMIQEIKTIEVKMSLGSVACIQKCLLTYTKSGREEFLEGTFTSFFEQSDSASGNMRGDDCGGGRMYLRKVKTSDFYVEPFLRYGTVPKPEAPPIVKNNASVTKPPVPKPSVTKPPVNQNSNKTASAEKQNADSIEKMADPITKNDTPKELEIKPKIAVPAILKQRQNDLVKTINIYTENIIIKIYDNGEIDDDTISVYLDNQLVLSKKRLTASALVLNLRMDESNDEHELVMVAENMGRIPPNTSLMIVTSGSSRHEVRITSTDQKNAVVRFKYIKKENP